MTRRLKIEVEMPNEDVGWFEHAVDCAERGHPDRSYGLRFRDIRSVEVVEPVRYTELVLRADGDFMWEPGQRAFVLDTASRPEAIHRVKQAGVWWTVVSCVDRVEGQ